MIDLLAADAAAGDDALLIETRAARPAGVYPRRKYRATGRRLLAHFAWPPANATPARVPPSITGDEKGAMPTVTTAGGGSQSPVSGGDNRKFSSQKTDR